jgi:hypothetical protein
MLPGKRFPIVLTLASVLAFGPSEKETKDLVEYSKSLERQRRLTDLEGERA